MIRDTRGSLLLRGEEELVEIPADGAHVVEGVDRVNALGSTKPRHIPCQQHHTFYKKLETFCIFLEKFLERAGYLENSRT